MRNIDNRRKKFAWLLLLVYVPMLLAITFHHHSGAEETVASYCNDCAHHIHHDGHFVSQSAVVQECLLCQLCALSYVVPVLVKVALCACRLCCLPCALSFCQDARRQRSFNACATCVLISVAFQKTICFSGSPMLEKLMTSNDL